MAGRQNYGFVDMTGMTVNGWHAIGRQQRGTSNRGAVWVIQHTCDGDKGEHRSMLGTQLRSKTPPKFCKHCRPNNRTGRPFKHGAAGL